MPATTARRITLLLAAALLALGLSRPAKAILVGAGSLDSLIRTSDAIVRARVISIERPTFERIAFTVQPIATIKAGPKPIPSPLSVTPAQPIWPEDLDVPYKKGAVVLLFLEGNGESYAVANNMRAILPAVEGTQIESNATPEVKVFRELSPVLKQLKTDAARSRLLGLLAEVGTKANTETFTPYLKDPNEWVRRGALSALLHLDPTPERVEQANADLKAFLKSPKRGDLFRLWSLYKVIDTENNAFLPMYRTIADSGNARPFDAAAVRGLRRGEKKEDALRLYHYSHSKSDYIRHEALDGLCKIYKIALKRPEVTSYEGPLSQEAVEQERRMRVATTRALKQDGVIK